MHARTLSAEQGRVGPRKSTGGNETAIAGGCACVPSARWERLARVPIPSLPRIVHSQARLTPAQTEPHTSSPMRPITQMPSSLTPDSLVEDSCAARPSADEISRHFRGLTPGAADDSQSLSSRRDSIADSRREASSGNVSMLERRTGSERRAANGAIVRLGLKQAGQARRMVQLRIVSSDSWAGIRRRRVASTVATSPGAVRFRHLREWRLRWCQDDAS